MGVLRRVPRVVPRLSARGRAGLRRREKCHVRAHVLQERRARDVRRAAERAERARQGRDEAAVGA
jgi:hypothetical protein